MDKISSKVVGLAFGALFIILLISFAIGFYSDSNQKKHTLEARQSIELVQKDGKTVLTEELLRADYKVYAQNNRTGIGIISTGLIGMTILIGLLMVASIVFLVMSKMRGEANGLPFIIAIVRSVSLVCVFVGAIVLCRFITKMIDNEKKDMRDDAPLYLEECVVTNKNSETKTSGSGDNESSTTYYYVYLGDGRKLSVSHFVYQQVETTGTYYIGKNESGAIFAMYSGSIYCEE